MSPRPSLTALYGTEQPVAIAHRGASALYPENTLLAMRQAIRLGANMLEFDLRLTRDGVPVVLHDMTLDRTSSLQGKPGDFSLEELRRASFAYVMDFWGSRTDEPAFDGVTIPSFEELLSEFADTICMNIQVYDTSEPSLREICRLYRQFDLFDRGFLAMTTFDDAQAVRAIDPDVEVAVLGNWQERSDPAFIRACKDFGCRFTQPAYDANSIESAVRCALDNGLYPNVFFSDTDVRSRRLIDYGAAGILTNRIDLLADLKKQLRTRC